MTTPQTPHKTSKRDKYFIIAAAIVFVLLLIIPPTAFMLDRLDIITVEDMANYKDPERLYFFDFTEGRVRYLPFWEGVNFIEVSRMLSAADHPETDNINYYYILFIYEEELFVAPTFRSLRQDNVPFFSNIYITIMNSLQWVRAEVNNVYTNFLPFYAQILRFENFNNNINDDFVVALHNIETARNNRTTAETQTTETQQETPSVISTPPPGNQTENYTTSTPPLLSPLWPENWPIISNPVIPQNLAQLNFISNRIADAGVFRVNRVRATDNSFGFLEITKAMTYQQARQNMYDELANINRIAAASQNLGVNFFVYFATTGQSTPWFSDVVPLEFSTYSLKREMFNGFENLSGLAYLDISTLEKRLERKWITDHHMNAYGSVQAYLEVHEMMNNVIPNFGNPVELLNIHYFPNVRFRGTGAARTQTPDFYDLFAVPIFDLPAFHTHNRVESRFNEYSRGNFDTRLYADHYASFKTRPSIVSVPSNNTDRNLLLLADSMVYWVIEPIASHFDTTHIHYTMRGDILDYAAFIQRHNITDVLLFQYGPRTLAKATSATVYLEQIITR